MSLFRGGRPRITVLVSLLLAAGLHGCSSWRVQAAPPAEVANQKPEKVRATLKGLGSARGEGSGYSGRHAHRPIERLAQPARIALADINRIEVRNPDTAKSWALVGGVVVAGVIALSLILAHAISEAIH